MDSKTKIEELKNLVEEFCEKRDWDQFHNPKDLAIGISTEANELLEIFRFKSNEDMNILMLSNRKKDVERELSDVFYFVLRFAQMYDIDLSDALINKLKENDSKYPVDKAKGKNNKYNDYLS